MKNEIKAWLMALLIVSTVCAGLAAAFYVCTAVSWGTPAVLFFWFVTIVRYIRG
jgi:hypothetical protein